MTAHRWAVVAIGAIDDEGAKRLADMPILDRLDRVCELLMPATGKLSDIRAVRGPICSDCRISWEDVEAIERTGKAWPCPGRRPDQLGGPLLDPPRSRTAPNRQQRRAKHRASMRDSGGEALQDAVGAAVVRSRQEDR